MFSVLHTLTQKWPFFEKNELISGSFLPVFDALSGVFIVAGVQFARKTRIECTVPNSIHG